MSLKIEELHNFDEIVRWYKPQNSTEEKIIQEALIKIKEILRGKHFS